MEPINDKLRSRLLVLLLAIMVLFFILFIRVTYLTFFNSHSVGYKSRKRIQRGIIYDRRGMELAISQDSATIGIQPEHVKDPAFTASVISQYVGMPSEKIESQIRGKSRYFLLKRELDKTIAKKITQMALPGVRTEYEFHRVYPNGTLASNLLGFVGLDDDRALSGLEYVYNDELLTPSKNYKGQGNDIHLTIDSLIQYRLETALGKAFIKTKSKKAVGVFMDVENGQIIAMASFPNFDPNRYYEYPVENTTNWAIRHVYEPGSTMKIFVVMILLNEGLITNDEKFYCPGYVEFGEQIVRCTGVHGKVNMEEILQHSCNVGIIKSVQKIPDTKLYEYLKKFKFGQRVGVSVNENRGYFPNLKSWNPSSAYFMSIGQGVSVTPVQLVTSAAAVVNGGKIHKPIVVSHISDKGGEILKKFHPETVSIGIKPSATRDILSALQKVVQKGTGKNAYLQDYSISGKTGTGQKARPGEGYAEGLFSASFLGFFPSHKPKIVGLILFDEPGGDAHSGGGIAAPVFREVVENIIPIIKSGETINSYKLAQIPEKKYRTPKNKLPKFVGKTMKEVILILKKYKPRYRIFGSGYCYKQEPPAGSPIKEGEIWNLYFQ